MSTKDKLLNLLYSNNQGWLNWQQAGLWSQRSEFKPPQRANKLLQILLRVSNIVAYVMYHKQCMVCGIPMARVYIQLLFLTFYQYLCGLFHLLHLSSGLFQPLSFHNLSINGSFWVVCLIVSFIRVLAAPKSPLEMHNNHSKTGLVIQIVTFCPYFVLIDDFTGSQTEIRYLCKLFE